jgi:hypothetical protein
VSSIPRPLRAAPNVCGTCTLCCTLMKVTMEPPKPARARCCHYSVLGCGIYADRPEPCRTFECMWLASHRAPDFTLPADMRPDRSGIVIDMNSVGTILAHCEQGDSWKREPMASLLRRYASQTLVILELPTGAALLGADGSTENLVKLGVDPITNNRLYIRASDAAALDPAALAAELGRPAA